MDRASRELDAEIWTRVHGQDMYWSIQIVNDDWRLRYYPGPPGPEYHALKRYTASLDSALTLVPEGWSVDLVRHRGDVGNVARVYNDGLKHEPSFIVHKNIPLPLAICAAA